MKNITIIDFNIRCKALGSHFFNKDCFMFVTSIKYIEKEYTFQTISKIKSIHHSYYSKQNKTGGENQIERYD